MPSRLDLQTLTRQRIDEAKALLPLNFVDAAFYLAGYSVECALKAAVCRTLDQDDFYQPDRTNRAARYVQNSILREFKTHNYSDLLVLSGLSAKFESAQSGDSLLNDAWEHIDYMGWSEQIRYQLGTKTQEEVSDFIEAVETLVTWISKYW